MAGIIALCSAAWALYHVGVSLLPTLVLLGTIISTYSHALPFGPVGTACFMLAVVWIELAWHPSVGATSEFNAMPAKHVVAESMP